MKLIRVGVQNARVVCYCVISKLEFTAAVRFHADSLLFWFCAAVSVASSASLEAPTATLLAHTLCSTVHDATAAGTNSGRNELSTMSVARSELERREA